MNFATRLREALGYLGWNATDLCCATGLGESTASHLLNSVTIPKLVTALTISEVTGWTIDSLTGEAELATPDFIRFDHPLHLATTEWGVSIRRLCDRFGAPRLARMLQLNTETVRKYYSRGVEPRLTTASRYAGALGQSVHAMAAGLPLQDIP